MGQLTSYHQLTMKLESALTRIATSKKSPRPSYQFQSNFMERMEECQDRKKKFIKQQQSKQDQQMYLWHELERRQFRQSQP